MSDQMRMLGLNSGLDTESIVSELIKAQSSKKTSLENDKTKLTWKQEIWKDLSSKVKTFYNKSLDNLRWSTSYKKKKTSVGDSRIASVVSSDNAVNGTQTMAVKQLAKSGYLTGGKLSDNGSVSESTTLSDLTGGKVAKDAELEYTMKVGDKEKTIKLNGSSTIGDMLKEFKEAGVNATFDKDNQRIFISATSSGKANDFKLTAKNGNSLTALASAGLLSKEDIAANNDYSTLAALYKGDDATTKADAAFLTKAAQKAEANAKSLLESLSLSKESIEQLKSDRKKLQKELDGLDSSAKDYEDKKKSLEDDIKAKKDAEVAKANEMAETYSKVKGYYEGTTDADTLRKLDDADKYLYADDGNSELSTLGGFVRPDDDAFKDTIRTDAEKDTLAEIKAAYDAQNNLSSLVGSRGAERVLGQDSIIMLNGVDYTSATNSVSVNGLTITAQTESEYSEVKDESGKTVRKYVETTVNTQDDVDGIYDMIKGFFKEYNDIIKEMDTKYNADRAKGYEPLTDEQKDSMSEDEVEKWEAKIKDSLLRKDTDLGSAISALKNNMLLSYTIDGKKYSLSNFGIETLSYFSAADNEHGIYHIDGDADDETTGTNPDKLKSLISTNPELVMNFFTQLANGVYKSLDKLMSRTDYRSKYSIYDDKALKDELTSYDDKIKKQEEYISNLEDRYYDQFTAMEKAMAEVNSKQSALSGLMGY